MMGWKLRYEDRRNQDRARGNSIHRVDTKDPATMAAADLREQIAIAEGNDNPWEIGNRLSP